VLLYNNVGFSKERSEIQDFDNPTVTGRFMSITPANIHTNLILLDPLTYILPQTVCVDLHSNFSGVLRKTFLFPQEGLFQPFKVIQCH